MKRTITMRIVSYVICCAIGIGCGSSKPADSVDADAAPTVAATSWTLAGTLTFPADETADQLVLVATTNETLYSASTYASTALALTYSGSPPVATFSLPIDTTRLGPLTGDAIMGLVVFRDVNGNGVNDPGEPLRQIGALDASSAVFGDGTQFNVDADFQYIAFGESGSGAGGSFDITVPGWYTSTCMTLACGTLIDTAHTMLSGVKLSFLYYDTSPI
jgi:hypothetical protein